MHSAHIVNQWLERLQILSKPPKMFSCFEWRFQNQQQSAFFFVKFYGTSLGFSFKLHASYFMNNIQQLLVFPVILVSSVKAICCRCWNTKCIKLDSIFDLMFLYRHCNSERKANLHHTLGNEFWFGLYLLTIMMIHAMLKINCS